VIAGRLALDAAELLDLIHAINPSGRDLDDRERSHRYALKSKLQSLLVRNHPDELVVSAVSAGVVSIAHRYLGRDACHAQLDALDPDARSWVHWKLDTADDDTSASRPGTVPPPRSAGHVNPLERGRQALAEYDYEVAHAAFREAFDASTADVDVARALLSLLVDLLAQDHEALALAARLPQPAFADPELRSMLALAAARAGDSRRARRWLADGGGERAAEAWIVLARTALASDDFDDVERTVREAETCDPANPSVVEVRNAVGERRRALRAPDESRLQELVATADDETLRARAREVLARWPDSVVAAKLLHAIDQRERQREIAKLLAASETALSAGEPVRARELATRAGMLGEDVSSIVARISLADTAARDARHTAQVAQVLAQLEAEPSAGYAAYLALEPDLRERVRALAPLPALGWLDAVAPARPRPATALVVAAVRALEDALAAEARGDRVVASGKLEEHESLLGELRVARQLRDRLRDALTAERREVHTRLLEDALAAWGLDDVDRATRILGELDAHALDREARALATQLGERVRLHREHVTRLARIDSLIAERQLLAARHELERAIAGLPAPDPDDRDGSRIHATLTQQWTDLRAAVRAEWPVQQATRGPIDARRLGAALGSLPYESQPEAWASSAGEVVLAAVHDRLAIVAILDVERDHMELRHVRIPAPLGEITASRIDHDRLWIAGQQWVLQLDWRSGELTRWLSLAELVPAGHNVERLLILPRDSMVWLETMEQGETQVQLIDLATWRVVRTPSSNRFLYEVPGEPARIAAFEHSAGASLYTARGHLVGELLQIANQRVVSLVRHPFEDGFIAAVARPDDDSADEIVLAELIGAHVRRRFPLPDTNPDMIFSLVSARAEGLLFAFHRTGEEAELFAMRPTPTAIELVYRIPAPSELVLVYDPASNHAYALWDSIELGIARLGATPPQLDLPTAHERLPPFAHPFICSYATKPHPLEPAENAAREHRWDRVRDLLASIAADDIPEPDRRHYYHLAGLAFARTGDLAAATHAWETGRALPVPEGRLFPCALDACLDLIADLPEPLPAAWWNHTASPSRQLRGAIATADACCTRGDHAGALAALQRRVVYRSREIQSLARLADLLIVTNDVDPFERACVLASFLDAVNHERSQDLPVPGSWDRAAIDLVAERARRLLGL
jgi:hypothetical protein